MKIKKFLFFSFLMMCIDSFAQNAYYVSYTNGSDSNNGTSSTTPFKNIYKAKKAASNIANPMGNITVNIMPGVHILDSTLVFKSSNSGKNGKKIIYQAFDTNNKPTISGGYEISSGYAITGTWKGPDTNGIYYINIGNKYSRQIYVNGLKARRASSEDNFCLFETKEGYITTKAGVNFQLWNNINDMEVVANMRWRHNRFPVKSVCGKQLTINPYMWNYAHAANVDTATNVGLFNRIPALRLENALELLDNVGEWYIKKVSSTGNILYYKPANISDLDKVTIPVLDQLITGADLSRVEFKNLNFCYSKWNKPSEYNVYIPSEKYGFYIEQSDRLFDITGEASTIASQIQCSLSFNKSTNVNFIGCSFSHIGSTALGYLEGCQDNIICTNTFSDIAATAVYIGDYNAMYNCVLNPNLPPIPPATSCNLDVSAETAHLVNNNSITNNTFSNIANDYTASCPILVTCARKTTIENNTLSNFPYIGISLGYGFSRNIDHGVNSISNNRIDCSNQSMPDGGGIYTLSNLSDYQSPGSTVTPLRTQINNNYILNQRFYRGAIYLDHSSSNIDVSNNLIDKVTNVNASNYVSFAPNYECVGDDVAVKAIECWYNSKNVTYSQNYYNGVYGSPLISLTNCESGDCTNLNSGVNKSFTGFGMHDQSGIITNSGVQTSLNCN